MTLPTPNPTTLVGRALYPSAYPTSKLLCCLPSPFLPVLQKDPSEALVIAVTTRAIFNLEEEHKLYLEKGKEAYARHQQANHDKPLPPGTAFAFVQVSPTPGQGHTRTLAGWGESSAFLVLGLNSHHGLQISLSWPLGLVAGHRDLCSSSILHVHLPPGGVSCALLSWQWPLQDDCSVCLSVIC